MSDSGNRRRSSRRKASPGSRSAAWCCSFGAVPPSPETKLPPRRIPPPRASQKPHSSAGYFHSSPSPTTKLGLGLIDPRRILSPGRVSPIDSDAPAVSPPDSAADPPPDPPTFAAPSPAPPGSRSRSRSLDLEVRIRGKDGRWLEMELDSSVVCERSSVLAEIVMEADRRKRSGGDRRRIEVRDVEDAGVFKETIELMFEEEDMMKSLDRVGVMRAIGILQVSSTLMFDKGISSCLRYLEAVPWNESEEEKLKALFASHAFEDSVAQDVLCRLYPQRLSDSDDLAVHLIQTLCNGNSSSARKELQSLVNGLLSKSSVYQKDSAGLNKESLYNICNSCLNSLLVLFEEASDYASQAPDANVKERRPLVERISKQVENLNWLLDILMENQMADDFVCIWANQEELISMHERSSPLVRYELSRISANIFIALGKGKIQCRGNIRSDVLGAWFGPMLVDFGWLQRCPKGMDMRLLEDGLGQALLTLPLRQQESLFVEWFRCFAGQGTECPNLSKAFQVWWRRLFVRNTEAIKQVAEAIH